MNMKAKIRHRVRAGRAKSLFVFGGVVMQGDVRERLTLREDEAPTVLQRLRWKTHKQVGRMFERQLITQREFDTYCHIWRQILECAV